MGRRHNITSVIGIHVLDGTVHAFFLNTTAKLAIVSAGPQADLNGADNILPRADALCTESILGEERADVVTRIDCEAYPQRAGQDIRYAVHGRCKYNAVAE